MKDPPLYHCLLLCRDVTRSQSTQSDTLHHVITELWLPVIPTEVPNTILYARLSNVHEGAEDLQVVFEHETGLKIFEISVPPPEIPDPMEVFTLSIRLPPLPIRRDGRYTFTVYHDDELLVTAPVFVECLPGEE